jgi:hypothetical protein
VFDENDSDITAWPDGMYTITDVHARLLIRRQARGARGGPCPPRRPKPLFHVRSPSEAPARRAAGLTSRPPDEIDGETHDSPALLLPVRFARPVVNVVKSSSSYGNA